MLGNALGGVRKSIGGLLEKPREAFGKTSGGFLKNLGTFLFSHIVRKYK